MKILLLSLALLPASAFAECDIYDAHHEFRGMTIDVSGGYAGVYPGASDSTPYAGDFRNGIVRHGEKDPYPIAKVTGDQLLSLQGTLMATLKGLEVFDAKGTKIGSIHNPYKNDGQCDSGEGLAGAAMFGL